MAGRGREGGREGRRWEAGSAWALLLLWEAKKVPLKEGFPEEGTGELERQEEDHR